MHLEENAEKEAGARRMRWSLCIGVQVLGTFLIQKGSALFRAEPFYVIFSEYFNQEIASIVLDRLPDCFLSTLQISESPGRSTQRRT